MATKRRARQPEADKKEKEGTVVHSRTVRRGDKEQKQTLAVDRSTARRKKGSSDQSEQIRETFGDGNVF